MLSADGALVRLGEGTVGSAPRVPIMTTWARAAPKWHRARTPWRSCSVVQNRAFRARSSSTRVATTVRELQEPSQIISPNPRAITDRVGPAVEPWFATK